MPFSRNLRTHQPLLIDDLAPLYCQSVLQAYAVVRFLLQYVLPVGCFAFCYGSIFYTIRRQSKVVSGHASRNQAATTATTSRDQQATGATTNSKLSRTEMNVLQTMVAVIACFMICWTVPSLEKFLRDFGVSRFTHSCKEYQWLCSVVADILL